MNTKKGFYFLAGAFVLWILTSFPLTGGPINYFEKSCFPVLTMNCPGFPSYQFSLLSLITLLIYLLFAFSLGLFTSKIKKIN